MKRSQINRIIEEARETFAQYRCSLPEWAFWSPSNWKEHQSDSREVRDHGLGWIVTDFGMNQFHKYGLVLFVARNGKLVGDQPATTKTYAEKFMIVRPSQVTPFHFHWKKTEDLVNRAGGRLRVKLAWPAADEKSLREGIIEYKIDGVRRKVASDEAFDLNPGQSIELPPKLCHWFAGHTMDKTVLAGEISSLNDDATDNCFIGHTVKSMHIEEDEPKKFLLASDHAL